MRSLFWLYRPTAPSVRAQSIQVVNAAHAMALRGHDVTLAVRAPEGSRPTPADVLGFYGLAPNNHLRLTVLPSSGSLASLGHRALFLRWLARTRGRGVAIARSKRYAEQASRIGGFRLVLEVHEVDSAQEAERGGDPTALRALEARVLSAASGVIANAPGTLELLRETHSVLPPAIALHNATHASRIRTPTLPGEGVGYVGSFLHVKDLETVARAAALLPHPIHLVGAVGAEVLQPLADHRLVLEPPLPHAAVPDRLARFRVLVLPVGHGLFGDRLTSPLKLWDYVASGVPIVGGDTPAIRSTGAAFHPYRPGDPVDLARAIDEAYTDDALRARLLADRRVRTWADRAAELDAFLDRIVP